MYNDTMQGKARYLGIIMGGTPQSIENLDRGLFSYEALKSRLESGRYGANNMINLMTPIIRIIPLSKEEIIVLLEKLAEIHADLYEYELKVKSEDIVDFIGEAVKEKEDITPRSIIRDFIEILNLSYQNYNFSIREIMDTFKYSNDKEDIEDIEE